MSARRAAGIARLLVSLSMATLVVIRPGPAAAELPKSLRISTFAFVENGKSSIRGYPLIERVVGEGWLEQELRKRGVELEWYPVTGDTGAVTNEAFAAGRIDFANIGDLPSVLLNAGGVRTAMVAPSGTGSDTYLLVPNDSPARSLRDLKGKRISVHRGRPWELTLRKLIEAEGLKPEDFRITNLDPRAGAAALSAGKVDAHFANNGNLLQDSGIGRIILSTRGRPARFKYRAEIWGTRAFIEAYPELTQLVVTAFVRASYWASQEANREEVIRIGTHNGTPERVVRLNYADDEVSWKARWSPLVDQTVREHYRDVAAAARAQRLIGRPVDAATLVDARFVEQAIRELGLQGYWTPPGKPIETQTKKEGRS